MAVDKIARVRLLALLDVLTERDRRYSERFAAQEVANRLALDAAEKAVLKAENAYERRFESVNEFRQTLTDQAATFMTRAEANALLGAVNEKLSRLDNHDSATTGRGAGMGQLWGIIAGVGGLLIGAASVAFAVMKG